MAGFTRELEEFYPSCFSSNPNPMGFTDSQTQHLSMSLPTGQKDFQHSLLKEEARTQDTSDPQSLPKFSIQQLKQEMVSPESSLDATLGSQRRKRTFYSQNKLDVLEQFFQTNMYPDIRHREDLAKRIYIPESRIQVWFQNRRAKERRDKAKSNTSPLVGVCYPSVRQSNSNMYPSIPQPNVTASQQNVFPKQRHQLVSSQQNHFQQTAEALTHPESTYAVSRQQTIMHQALQSQFQSRTSPANHSGTQQHFYKYSIPTRTVQEKVMDLSKKHKHIPFHPGLLMDLNNFPPNKTITPDMNVIIPPIPTSASSNSHNRMNVFGKKIPSQIPTLQDDSYEIFSPDSDSGVSESSPVSLSDF
ncbi:hypothetical protein GDO86_009145 [Hymenochirus boettgeri]|uniref:Homeobox domain-containing protein n=1 Tax=Hymenochirus boettgeri TaxID=247094 RepID=A0A8T2JHS7_9PIPI|nr:hypothetical protein GDO86_009145 [Hymenochirus boettgeri]